MTGHRPFIDLIKRFSPERQARIAATSSALHEPPQEARTYSTRRRDVLSIEDFTDADAAVVEGTKPSAAFDGEMTPDP